MVARRCVLSSVHVHRPSYGHRHSQKRQLVCSGKSSLFKAYSIVTQKKRSKCICFFTDCLDFACDWEGCRKNYSSKKSTISFVHMKRMSRFPLCCLYGMRVFRSTWISRFEISSWCRTCTCVFGWVPLDCIFNWNNSTVVIFS